MSFEATRRRFLAAAAMGGVLKAADDPFSGASTSFGARGRAILATAQASESYRGRIGPSDVTALMDAERVTRDGLMLKLIPVAKSRAHAPISNYLVGAVVLGSSGSLYLGCNIEIPGNMLSLAVHAEQAAVAIAYMSHEEGIEALTVGAAPCGHCRQFLSEVSLDVSMRLIMSDGTSTKLSDLLPHSFGPKNLGFKQGSFPVREAHLSLASSLTDALAAEALKAASCAYAPYSRSPSGVALSTTSGRVFSGSYIENAAFNPSLPPLEAALAGYFAAGEASGQIRRAVLVEGENSAIRQHVTTQSVLSALAPDVRLERHALS